MLLKFYCLFFYSNILIKLQCHTGIKGNKRRKTLSCLKSKMTNNEKMLFSLIPWPSPTKTKPYIYIYSAIFISRCSFPLSIRMSFSCCILQFSSRFYTFFSFISGPFSYCYRVWAIFLFSWIIQKHYSSWVLNKNALKSRCRENTWKKIPYIRIVNT